MHGPNVGIVFDANTYGTVEDMDPRYGFKILEEAVSNSNYPLFAASTFHGEVTLVVIATSDNDFAGKLSLSNGDLAVKTATITYKDVSGASKTRIITGRWHEVQDKITKGEFTRFTIKCVMNALPTGTMG